MKYKIEKDFTIYISAEIEAYNEEDALKEFEGLTEPLLVQLEE